MTRGVSVSERVLVLTFLVAVCAVRFIGLARYSFDTDEVFSLRAAQASWAGMFGIAARDVSHPPLFYVLLKTWLYLGPATEGWVRLLPALLGAAAFVPFYAICRRLRLEPGGLAVALALFTANTVLIEYAQYTRMFSLLQFAGALSILAFLVFTESGGRRAFWALTAANVLMVYSHYWGWMAVLAQLCILLLLRRDRLLDYLKSAALVVLAFLPWAWAVAAAASSKGSATAQIHWMAAPDWLSLVWLFGNLTGAPGIPRGTAIGLALFAVPLGFLAWRLTRERAFAPLCLVLLVAVPVAATFILGHVLGQPVWGERHLSMVAVPYFLLVAMATMAVPWARVRAGLQIVLMLWATWAGAQFLLTPNRMLQWGQLVDGMIEDSAGRPLVIRTAEPFIHDPVVYFVGRSGAHGVEVTLDDDPAHAPGERFWYVVRDITWTRPESPVQLLSAAGFRIESMLAITTPGQVVVAYRVGRGP